MNTKNSLLEERPSPSGSSGSSDRASIQNHNGMLAYKMQQQIHNSINNMTSGQHPYQNVNPNPKMFNNSNSFVETNHNSINYKQMKQNPNSYNNNTINYKQMQNNSINTNQSVIQSHSVPTVNPNQNQSQTATKVPPNTKPKPIVPPKPSVPVKPIPPPRQSPNDLYGPQIGNESVEVNALSSNTRNNGNSFNKKSSNLLTTSNATISSTNSGYNRRVLQHIISR